MAYKVIVFTAEPTGVIDNPVKCVSYRYENVNDIKVHEGNIVVQFENGDVVLFNKDHVRRVEGYMLKKENTSND